MTAIKLVDFGLGVRGMLGFMTWLDTARFFDVAHLRALDGRRIPVDRELSALYKPDALRDQAIGVAIVALNEEAYVRRAIESVSGFAEDVVVVDGGSIDDTVGVAERSGARVLRRRHDMSSRGFDFAKQRNFAASALRTPWILSVDADEFVPTDLASLLADAACQPGIDTVFLPILNLIEGEDTPFVWPAVVPRLYRRSLSYRQSLHEHVHGYTRSITLPISGPYLMHVKSLRRHYEASLRYAAVDPTPYTEDWLDFARKELERLNREDAADDRE
jgi:glycosyltransferase involved in cell wall biosynthesis